MRAERRKPPIKKIAIIAAPNGTAKTTTYQLSTPITDPEILGELAALRRAARAAKRLAKATGTPFYVMKNGRIVDLMAGSGKRRKRTV